MALFVLRKLILHTRMRSYRMWLDVWFLVGHFVYFHTSCVRTGSGRSFAGRLCDKYHNLMSCLSWFGTYFLCILISQFMIICAIPTYMSFLTTKLSEDSKEGVIALKKIMCVCVTVKWSCSRYPILHKPIQLGKSNSTFTHKAHKKNMAYLTYNRARLEQAPAE